MVITLLTDFGLSDVYVGVMKGVIATIAPHVSVIDLTHQIPPQDIATARFQLMNAYPYFPPKTVHIAVVDPGVGSSRRAIAVQLETGFLVAPDNGLISGVLSQNLAITAVELTNPNYWRTSNPSFTFHGRDVFAPIGAYLAIGASLRELGDTIELSSLQNFPIPDVVETPEGLEGSIQAIDHFGNLITNIPVGRIQDRSWSIQIGNNIYPGKTTYADANPSEILGLVGSHGWIEIAANRGNAQEILGLNIGGLIKMI